MRQLWIIKYRASAEGRDWIETRGVFAESFNDAPSRVMFQDYDGIQREIISCTLVPESAPKAPAVDMTD